MNWEYKILLCLSLFTLNPTHSHALLSTIPQCREISSALVQDMMSNPNNGFTNDNFIKLNNGNAFTCISPHSNSRYNNTVAPNSCSGGHTIIKTRNNRISEIIKCSDSFYSIQWNQLPICHFGNVAQPTAYFPAFDYGDDRYILTQSREPNTFYRRQTADNHTAIVIESYEYDLCRVNINDVCVSPTNNRFFPAGFYANVSYKKATEINPRAAATLQTPRQIKTVTVSCENINGGSVWREKINKCIDGYELKDSKCIKKSTAPTPTPTPTKPSQPIQKIPPLPHGPKIDTPGATIQNPIGITVPINVVPHTPVLYDDIEIPDEDIVIEDDLFKDLDSNINVPYLDIDGKPCNSKPGAYWNHTEKKCVCTDSINTEWNASRTECVAKTHTPNAPVLPVLDDDIEISDEDIVIEDDLFKDLDSNINVPYLDIDGKPCNSKPGAYWNHTEKKCVCTDSTNTEWNASRTECFETEQARQKRLAQEAKQKLTQAKSAISQSVSTLSHIASEIDISKWRTADGTFNTARLTSDSIAGVVLGTTGGLITSHIVKKNQISSGFEDIKCTIAGQSVATFGDEFNVGIK